MECPKCGFKDTVGPSCPKCGIVISRYLDARAGAAPGEMKIVIHYDRAERKSRAGWYLLALLILGGAGGLFWRASAKQEPQPPPASSKSSAVVNPQRSPSASPAAMPGLGSRPAPPLSPAPEISEPPEALPHAAAPEPQPEAQAVWQSSYSSYDWHENADGFKAAVEEHKSYGAPMVIYFHTEWCGYCKRLDRNYLSDSDVDLFLSGLVKVKINPEDGPAEKSLAQSYGVTGYPTFLILGRSGVMTRVHPFIKTDDGGWAEVTTQEFIRQCQAAAR